MKSVKNKKSVIFCAFSFNVNNIFCDANKGGLCDIWSANNKIEREKGPKENLIDSIINSELKIKDSNNVSLVNNNVISFNEELVKHLKDKNVTKGVLTEFEYKKNFYYFFSAAPLNAKDFKLPQGDTAFSGISKNFKKFSVVLKEGNLIVKKYEPYAPVPRIQNPYMGAQDTQNPIGDQSCASLETLGDKEFNMCQGKEPNIANDMNNKSNASGQDTSDFRYQFGNFNNENYDNDLSQGDSNNYYGESGVYNTSDAKDDEKNSKDKNTNNYKEKERMNSKENKSDKMKSTYKNPGTDTFGAGKCSKN